MNSNEIEVSICMITYNHGPYIEESIKSALGQKTNFRFEIIIGDDVSTDNTKSIINNILNEFNEDGRIIFIQNEVNIGAARNFANVMKRAKGRYIALLEGDDAWTNENKLQVQVDFMENNLTYSTIFHTALMVDRYNNHKGYLPNDNFKKSEYGLIDLLKYDSFMPTCSIMFRSNLFEYFPEVYYTSRNMCDWPLNILNAEKGKIKFLDICMSKYRTASSVNAWSTQRLNLILDNAIVLNQAFDEYFNFKYNDIFKEKIKNYKCQIIFDSLRHSEILECINPIRNLYYEYGMFSLLSLGNLNMFLKSVFIGIIKRVLLILGLKKSQI